MTNSHNDRRFWSVIPKALSTTDQAAATAIHNDQPFQQLSRNGNKTTTLEMREQPIMVVPTLDLPTHSTEDHLRCGDVLFQQGMLSEAIVHYRQAIQHDPDNSEAYQHLADALTQQGDLNEAAVCYRQAIVLETERMNSESDCQNGSAVIEIDSTEIKSSAISHCVISRKGKFEIDEDDEQDDDENDEHLNESLDSLPWYESAAFHIQQMQVLCEEREWKEALQNAENALELLEPRLAETYYLVGLSLQEQGKFVEAEAFYQKALVIQPQAAEVLARLGSLFVQQQSWQQAIEPYEKAIALQPDFAEAHWDLADVYEQLGDSVQAALARHHVLRLAPDWVTVQERIQLGNRLLAAGYAQEALGCLRDAVRQDPNNGSLYHSIGTALGQLEQWQEALPYLQNAADRTPENPALHLSLGQAFEALEQGQEALQSYNQAIRLAPEDPAGYMALRDFLVGQGQWREALPYYQTLAMLQPDRAAEEYVRLGNWLQRQGETNRAVDCYHWAIHSDPENALPYYHLGEALTALNQQEALFYFRRAVQCEPQNVELLEGLAAALLTADQREEAIHCYQQIIQLQPDNLNIYYQLRDLFTVQERWQEALPYYQKVTELQPDCAISWHTLGDVAGRLAQWEDAAAAYEEAIDLNPDFAWSYNNLGDALRNLELWQNAIDAYEQAIGLNPDFYWAHYCIAECAVKLSQWDRAIEAYQQAIRLNPKEPIIPCRLAETLKLRATADQESALQLYLNAIEQQPDNLQAYHNALELQPNNALIHDKLSSALERSGQADNAAIFSQLAKWSEALFEPGSLTTETGSVEESSKKK